jgi:hypothetical protein
MLFSSGRQHHDDHYDSKNQRISDHSRYRQSLRRQRRCEKHSAEFEYQQDCQSRISEPILPGMDQTSPVIDGD